MSQKWGSALVAIAALVASANLQAEETAKQDSSEVHIKIKGPDEIVLILPFLQTELVQKDLNLTAEQKEKITEIEKARKEKIQKLENETKNLSQKEILERNKHFDFVQFQKDWAKEAADIRKKLDETLLPGQF